LKLFEIKAGLMITFGAIFAVLLLVSLIVAERLAPRGPSIDAEDEFVRRVPRSGDSTGKISDSGNCPGVEDLRRILRYRPNRADH